MKFALIAPTKHINTSLIGTQHMAIAPQVITDAEYSDFYRRQSQVGKYVILDNGAFENGESIAVDRLLELAQEINASEIVVPDVYMNREESTLLTRIAYDELRSGGFEGSLMIVPQGEDEDSWVDSFMELFNSFYDEQNIVWGIPKWLAQRSIAVRERLIRRVLGRMDPGTNPPTFHALGLHSVGEISRLQENMLVRSFDTSLPYVHAYFGAFLDENRFFQRPASYFEARFARTQRRCMYANIAHMILENGLTLG